MIRCLAYAFKVIFKSRARLVAENLCLRQQLIVFKRRLLTFQFPLRYSSEASRRKPVHGELVFTLREPANSQVLCWVAPEMRY